MATTRQTITRSISQYSTLSGNDSTQEFYNIQNTISADTQIFITPLETLTSPSSDVKPTNGKEKTLLTENEKVARMAVMFASEIEEIRKDNSFTGSSNQVQYLQNILAHNISIP